MGPRPICRRYAMARQEVQRPKLGAAQAADVPLGAASKFFDMGLVGKG